MRRKHRSGGRSRNRLSLETLECRCLLDAQLGELIGLAGSELGTITQDPVPPPANEAQEPRITRFEYAAELEDFLRKDAEQRYGHLFGQEVWHEPWRWYTDFEDVAFAARDVSALSNADFSTTNVQVAGVDEGDIVKTDGRYLYLNGERDITIVDAGAASELTVAARVEIHGNPIAMYLNDDRLTVVSTSFGDDVFPMPMTDVAFLPMPEPVEREVVLTIIDISSPVEPELVSQFDIEGSYIDSRMIGDTVFLVSSNSFHLPAPEIIHTPSSGQSDVNEPPPPDQLAPENGSQFILPIWTPPPDGQNVYETQEEYWARIGDDVLSVALPNYTSFGPDGQPVDTGLLQQPEDIYRPFIEPHDNLVSITAIGVSDDVPLVNSTAAPMGWSSEVYVSAENLYLISPHFWALDENGTGSSIHKFSLGTEGDGIKLVATGHVPGNVLNQFSMDEHDGYLRIVTQQGWGRNASSHLYVLEQIGDGLEAVGSVEDLAPGERLYSVRFMEDRAFVVTFGPTGGGWFDPLFTIDLSDPTSPQVQGELEIPGFSNYLQLIKGDYLIGLGRNADETNGRSLEPQVSLYDVADFSDPQLADRLSFGEGGSAWSEAFRDHHAISYFPDQAVLAIPMSTFAPVRVGLDGTADGNMRDARPFRHQSALWLFQIDTQAETDKIRLLGQIEHDSNLRRSVRIGGVLYSISRDTVKAHEILDPGATLGEVYYGRSARGDRFVVDRNSSDNALDVLANDAAAPDTSQWPIITAVSDTTAGGEIAITEDGRSLQYTPADGFFGIDSFDYTVDNGPRGVDSATVTLEVVFAVDEDSADVQLDVLAGLDLPYTESAVIVEVEGRHPEGQATVSEDGQSLIYSPAPDFTGTEWLHLTVGYDGREETTEHRLSVRVKSINDDPNAEDDHFVLEAERPEHVLRVLRNDTSLPDMWEPLTITKVGATTGGGSVGISSDGSHLLYAPGWITSESDSFTYTISDGNGGFDEAAVTIELVWPDNARRMVELAKQDLAERLDVPADELAVISVDEVVWPNGCMGVHVANRACTEALVDGFRIVLEHDDTGYVYHTNTRQTVIFAESYPLEDLVQIRVEASDASGQVITTVETGEDFTLNVYVQDLREQPEGVYSAYADILYYARSIFAGDEILFGKGFPNGQSGDLHLPGLVNEVGAFSDLTPPGGDERLLASIPFVAHRAGSVSFVLTPADRFGNEVLVYGSDDVVPPGRVGYVGTEIEVVPGWRNVDRPTDVNDDGQTTPADALALINDLNRGGPRPLARLAHAASQTAGALHYYLDVSGDGKLSPLDALMIINDLNNPAAQDDTADGGQNTTTDGTQGSGQPLVELIDWQALETVLQSDLLAGPLETLSLSPADALDLAHEILVGVDVDGLASGIADDLLGGEAFQTLMGSLTPLIEEHLDDVPIDELLGFVGELKSVFDDLDVRGIVPVLPEDVDLAQIKQSFRDRLFASLANPLLPDALTAGLFA